MQLIEAGSASQIVGIRECVDSQVLGAWIRDCQKHHKGGCSSADERIRASSFTNIMLIDVLNECLVEGNLSDEYAILSYMWGGGVTITTTLATVENFKRPRALSSHLNLPETVADAIKMTRGMGFRYLWADCLCVIQDSPNKHREITNMDLIYSQAQVTIVAVSSEHANIGLPGVRPGTRKTRMLGREGAGATILLRLTNEKSYIVKDRLYVGRGWTFQELHLSRRLLLVQENQVTFFCDTCWRSESEAQEHILREQDRHYSEGKIALRLPSSHVPDDADIVELYEAAVSEYSKRQLTYSGDIESAFAGIASILQNWCEGVPIVHGCMLKYFQSSITWFFREEPTIYSFAAEAQLGSRRDEFPTWTWTGWNAPVVMLVESVNPDEPTVSLIQDVALCQQSSFPSMQQDVLIEDRSVIFDEQNEPRSDKIQQIRFTLRAALAGEVRSLPSIWSFESEYVPWEGFEITTPGQIFAFTSPGASEESGFISVAPCDRIIRQAISSAHSDRLRLIRLYRVNLDNPGPDREQTDHVDNVGSLLDFMEDECIMRSKRQDFRKRLSSLPSLFVLLIQCRGEYWERLGSGLMLEEDWVSEQKIEDNEPRRDTFKLI